MKDPLKATTGLSLAGLFVLFAAHGEAFWKGAVGAWGFLLAITTTAPAGVASFLLALLLGTLATIALKRGMPPSENAHARGFLIETIAGTVALAAAWAQVRTTQGLLWGICAGLLAPYIAKAVMGIAQYLTEMAKRDT